MVPPSVDNLLVAGRLVFNFSRSVLTRYLKFCSTRYLRIANLDPDIRMNSKDEFLQGCNIFMQPVRGVGV